MFAYENACFYFDLSLETHRNNKTNNLIMNLPQREDKTFIFVTYYCNHECLWNTSSSLYKNNIARNNDYENLLHVLLKFVKIFLNNCNADKNVLLNSVRIELVPLRTSILAKNLRLNSMCVLLFAMSMLICEHTLVKTKRVALDKETAGNFYKEHLEKFFFNRLVTFMTSGSVDLHIIGHINAIELWRKMLGPTKVYRAQFQEPHCLRGMFGLSDTRNVAHGSDSASSAEREIKFFFPDFSFYNWHNNDEITYRKGPIIFNDHKFQHVRKL